MKTIKRTKDEWIVILPIVNLRLSSLVNNEFRIDRVTFLTAKRLKNIQKRLKLPRPLTKIKQFLFANKLLTENSTLAYLFMSGEIENFQHKAYKIVEDELSIFSASLVGYTKRSYFIAPRIQGFNVSHLQNNLFIGRKTNSLASSSSVKDMTSHLSLDTFWLRMAKKNFFIKALKIIRGTIKVEGGWKNSLTRALKLIGKSKTTRNVADAFLWNMIAMEMLTTVQGDKYTEVLPERLESILGWVGDWKQSPYLEAIKDLYQKRCQYVHDGNSDNITINDLIFSDELVCNLINNVIRNHNIFKSKESVIKFAEKVKAEHILGIKSKTRPKNLNYWKLMYSTKDLKNSQKMSGLDI